jgi:hypothetical protein
LLSSERLTETSRRRHLASSNNYVALLRSRSCGNQLSASVGRRQCRSDEAFSLSSDRGIGASWQAAMAVALAANTFDERFG